MTTNPRGAYSQVAVSQLDDLEAASDIDLYNAILENCHLIFEKPKQAQSFSTAITTEIGILFQLPVPGYPLTKYSGLLGGQQSKRFLPTRVSNLRLKKDLSDAVKVRNNLAHYYLLESGRTRPRSTRAGNSLQIIEFI